MTDERDIRPTGARPPWRRVVSVAVQRKFLFGGGVVLAATLFGFYSLLMGGAFDTMLARRIAHVYEAQPDFDDDALHAFLCGSSSPISSATRAQACVGVVANGDLYLFDVGAGAWNNIALWRAPQDRLKGVFLTHFHSDHFSGLGEANVQSWIWGRTDPITVYGPPGVEEVVAGFNMAFAHDYDERGDQAGEALMPRAAADMKAAPIQADGDAPVFVDGEFSVRAVSVDHVEGASAYGYLIEYRGRRIVISGDTKKSNNLIAASLGADLIFHEAYSERMIELFANAIMLTNDERAKTFVPRFQEAHTSTREAIEVKEETGARMLVLYHHLPPPRDGVMKRMYLKERPGVIVGDDGLWLRLPTGSEAIERRSL